MSPALANRHGIIAMLMAMTLFTANDALLKLAAADLPPGQIMAVRGLMACLIASGWVLTSGQHRQLGVLRKPILLARAGLEALISFLFITSLSQLPLANVTAILQATPLILTLMAMALGMEQVGWRRWSAIGVGFAGVLLIVKPSATGFNLFAWFALAAAVLIAARDLVTRVIGGQVPSVVITLSATLAVTLTGLALSAGEAWRPVTARDAAVLGSAAIFVTLGNVAIVRAFQVGEMSVVAPFRYSVVLTSLLVGYWAFGEWPDLMSWLGIILIVLSGIYTLHREQLRQREAQHLLDEASAGERT